MRTILTDNMILDDIQYKALSHILDATKMDCWFHIERGFYRGKWCDYCYDLENKRKISLKTALSQAMDGFIDLELLGISQKEINILNNILVELKLLKEKEVV